MRTKKCNLLKLSLLLFSFLGSALPGAAQDAAQSNGNTVVYNQSGIGTSIVVVFVALVIILLVFKYFGKLMAGEKKPVAATAQPQAQAPAAPQADPQGEINAAIAMALYLYSNELHDQENPVITMIRVSKTYSPWSSKIYGLRKLPR
jgi:Na+-transporting methylmalonyl-CoA/oxaloacetate decarboxylase gamma subunit